MAKQIGYAVVGAGPLVERALLPAFARAGGETRLAAIVSADRGRAQTLAQEHHATGYHYDEFRQALQREDVVLPGDLALRKAIQAAYRLDHLPVQQEVLAIAEKWRPYRSLATSYLFSAAFDPAR